MSAATTRQHALLDTSVAGNHGPGLEARGCRPRCTAVVAIVHCRMASGGMSGHPMRFPASCADCALGTCRLARPVLAAHHDSTTAMASARSA
eukprot:7851200-Heterocapsa_arctica.AAC.1